MTHRAAAWILLALSGASVAGAEPDDSALTLETLMRGMAGTSGVRASFREEKRLALLSEPVESRGTLYFAPPDRMLRITEAPSRSRLAIDGERVVFEDATGADALDLSASPIAGQYVANFVVLFNGDLDALRERYEPSFETTDTGWRLALRPRGRPLSDVVARVLLEGAGRAITRMELVEADGDRTVTWFDEVETDVEFGSGELDAPR